VRNFSPQISHWNVWFGAESTRGEQRQVSKARARARGSRSGAGNFVHVADVNVADANRL
jgi:hypothetical protein